MIWFGWAGFALYFIVAYGLWRKLKIERAESERRLNEVSGVLKITAKVNAQLHEEVAALKRDAAKMVQNNYGVNVEKWQAIHRGQVVFYHHVRN